MYVIARIFDSILLKHASFSNVVNWLDCGLCSKRSWRQNFYCTAMRRQGFTTNSTAPTLCCGTNNVMAGVRMKLTH